MIRTEIDMTTTFACEGTFKKGTEDRFSTEMCQWLPGEPDEVLNFKVYKVRKLKIVDGVEKVEHLDVTEWLTEKEYDELYDRFLKDAREEENE